MFLEVVIFLEILNVLTRHVQAILSRKLVVAEIEDVLRKVEQLSITAESAHVRLQCRQVGDTVMSPVVVHTDTHNSSIYQMFKTQHHYINTMTCSRRYAMVLAHVKRRQLRHTRTAILIVCSK